MVVGAAYNLFTDALLIDNLKHGWRLLFELYLAPEK